MTDDVRVEEAEQLHLSDLLSRVLDKGVVIVGHVTIAVADIDLIRVKLNVLLGSVESEARRADRPIAPADSNADVPLLRADAGE
jgi:hypothetical protein